ncbi:MAG: hypothetical protein JNK07_04995 [Alphaproteobacteria bacterium]|nr:hypothetical protein [Alphaproteobacteria bacterium]
MLVFFDVLTIGLAMLAAYLWFISSRTRYRRISRKEEIDAGDLNRIIVAMNRSQIANQRAALATAASAFALALRLLLDLVLRLG